MGHTIEALVMWAGSGLLSAVLLAQVVAGTDRDLRWYEVVSQVLFNVTNTLYWLVPEFPGIHVAHPVMLVVALPMWMGVERRHLLAVRQREMQAARESMARLLAKARLPVSMFQVDADERIVFASRGALTLAGEKTTNIVGKTLEQTIGDRPDLLNGWRLALDGRPSELLHRSQAGELLWTQWAPVPGPEAAAEAITVKPKALSKGMLRQLPIPPLEDADLVRVSAVYDSRRELNEALRQHHARKAAQLEGLHYDQ